MNGNKQAPGKKIGREGTRAEPTLAKPTHVGEEEAVTAAKLAWSVLKRKWFGGRFGADNDYMVRLLVGAYLAAKEGKPITKKGSLEAIGAEDIKTARKYVAVAENQGLLLAERSAMDKRQELLWPTEELIVLLSGEMRALRNEWAGIGFEEGVEDVGAATLDGIEQLVSSAFVIAGFNKHSEATLVHLLLALTMKQSSVDILEKCGVNVARLQKVTLKHLKGLPQSEEGRKGLVAPSIALHSVEGYVRVKAQRGRVDLRDLLAGILRPHGEAIAKEYLMSAVKETDRFDQEVMSRPA